MRILESVDVESQNVERQLTALRRRKRQIAASKACEDTMKSAQRTQPA